MEGQGFANREQQKRTRGPDVAREELLRFLSRIVNGLHITARSAGLSYPLHLPAYPQNETAVESRVLTAF